MDKKAMLNAIISHYTDGNKSKFATKLGITPQAINSWENRNTFDIDLIYSKCEGINANWLLTGEGNMISDNESSLTSNHVVQNVSDDEFWKNLVSQLSDDLKYWKNRCASVEEQLSKMEDLKDNA